MGKADLHIHTSAGDGVDDIARILAHVEENTDLDVIAITEHDNLSVAMAAREAWARGRFRFEVIPGAEITTLQGHLIALFLEEPIESLRPVEETIDAVHRQGGVCFVPHPLSWWTRSINERVFQRVRRLRDRGLWFDGIELANETPAARRFRARARELNDKELHLPAIGASDAHFVQAIGSAFTRFEGSSAADLKRAFARGSLHGVGTRYPSVREVGAMRMLTVPMKGLGATPRALGWRRTVWSFARRYWT
ncbi:MAG TPA: PHP-associated domain-containing protein [Dehalococcoidia bacterium]|nr:PHP-associated domain-containing protein [Dehalococcoidia bacterium]